MSLTREHLVPNRIYFDRSCEQYFYSPDGVGVIWYDTKEEAREDTGIESAVVSISELEDF